MGGPSAEHEISLNTGSVVLEALDRGKYELQPVVIDREGRWLSLNPETSPLRLSYNDLLCLDANAGNVTVSSGPPAWRNRPAPVDVAFIAMHGPFGEDGSVQGLLEVLDIPYTGSGVLASALAMDKRRAKQVLAANGLQVPKDIVITESSFVHDPVRIEEVTQSEIGFPCVVKPNAQGSSVGTSICSTAGDLTGCLRSAFEVEANAMIEEYVAGIELTCGVLEAVETGQPEPLPVIEIVPNGYDFFDFEAKYTPGATDEICPARIPDALRDRAQQAAVIAHQSLGCRGFSRTDFILRGDELLTLELNTIPGMTPTSLLPKAAKAAGIEFSEMLDRIIQVALKVHREKHGKGVGDK